MMIERTEQAAMIAARNLKAADAVARCTKCGRGFVWISPTSDMTDCWPAMGSPKDNREPCGGKIEMLAEPATKP